MTWRTRVDHAKGDEARERIAYVRQVIADFDR